MKATLHASTFGTANRNVDRSIDGYCRGMVTQRLPDWGERARRGCLDALRVVAWFLVIGVIIRIVDWSLDADVEGWLSAVIPTPIGIIVALIGSAAFAVTFLAGTIWLAAAVVAGYRVLRH